MDGIIGVLWSPLLCAFAGSFTVALLLVWAYVRAVRSVLQGDA